MPRHVLLLLALPALIEAQPGVTKLCSASITTIAQCPATGCSDHPSDARLNRAKNRTSSPHGAPKDITVSAIKQIPEPTDWTTGKNRSSLHGPGREGTAVRLIG